MGGRWHSFRAGELLRQCQTSNGARLRRTPVFPFSNLCDGAIIRHILVILGVILALNASPGAAGPQSDTALLAFIRHYESGGAYDRYHTDIRQTPPKPLTRMTVGEVMAWQASLRNVISTASGGYQIIKVTLARMVRTHRIDRAALFDATMQDRLARLLIAECQDDRRKGGNIGFANCLAGIWAALPLVSGPARGRSAYHGIAGNKAQTTPARVMAVLEGAAFTAPSGTTRHTRSVATRGGYQDRYARIRTENARVRSGGGLGRSVVYSRDPYAVE